MTTFNEEITIITENDTVNATTANAPHNEIHENVRALYELIYGTTSFTLSDLVGILFGNYADYSGNGAKILTNGGKINSSEKVDPWVGINKTTSVIDNTKIEYSVANTAMTVHANGIAARDLYIPKTSRGNTFIVAIKGNGGAATINVNGETKSVTLSDSTDYYLYSAASNESILQVQIQNDNASADILVEKIYVSLFTGTDIKVNTLDVDNLYNFAGEGSPIITAGTIDGLQARVGTGSVSVAYMPIADGVLNTNLNAEQVGGYTEASLSKVGHTHSYSPIGHTHDDLYVTLEDFDPSNYVSKDEFDPTDYITRTEFDPSSINLADYATKTELEAVENNLSTLSDTVAALDVPVITASVGDTYYDSSGDTLGSTLSLTINGETYNIPSGGSGGTCFEIGTKILRTKDENVKLEQLKVGDMILGWDEENGCVADTKVIETHIRTVESYYQIEINKELYKVTSEHPWMTIDNGWVKTEDLTVGDNILKIDGNNDTISSINFIEGELEVVNVSCSPHETYILDNLDIIHNCHSNCHSACFTGNTKITHFDNTISDLKDVKLGDKLLGYDIDNNIFNETEVVNHEVNQKNVYDIEFDSSEKISVTMEHPFLTPNGFVQLKDLKIGSLVIGLNGTKKLTSFNKESRLETVYTIECSPHHNYIVGDSKIVVKNCDFSAGSGS